MVLTSLSIEIEKRSSLSWCFTELRLNTIREWFCPSEDPRRVHLRLPGWVKFQSSSSPLRNWNLFKFFTSEEQRFNIQIVSQISCRSGVTEFCTHPMPVQSYTQTPPENWPFFPSRWAKPQLVLLAINIQWDYGANYGTNNNFLNTWTVTLGLFSPVRLERREEGGVFSTQHFPQQGQMNLQLLLSVPLTQSHWTQALRDGQQASARSARCAPWPQGPQLLLFSWWVAASESAHLQNQEASLHLGNSHTGRGVLGICSLNYIPHAFSTQRLQFKSYSTPFYFISYLLLPLVQLHIRRVWSLLPEAR